jgi:muramoyltetrapeptide carboxypeptidase
MTAPLVPPLPGRGGRLGIFAPAGQLQERRRFAAGVKILQQMGFRLTFPAGLWPGMGYFADSDENRAAEFNRLFGDPEVKALLALRGGYGSLRILDRLDLARLARQPKLVIGFSDLTVLLNALYGRIGLLSLHGPTLSSLAGLTEAAGQRFYRFLAVGDWEEIASPQIEVLRPGPTVRAPLIGGNLASLLSLVGTPWDFSWDGKILLLEETNEPGYRVDRMLSQLRLAGKLAGIKGLLLGDFSHGTGSEGGNLLRYREGVWLRALEVVADLACPVWANLPCGHCPNNLVFPIGGLAEMNRERTRLFFSRPRR